MDGVTIPSNLALFTNESGPAGEVISKILKGQTDLITNLVDLSKFWRVRVWFKTPVQIRVTRRRVMMTAEHVFAGFFVSDRHRLCYATRRPMRTGYFLDDRLSLVTGYEPVSRTNRAKDEFTSKEQFERRFDKTLITQTEIDDLWNGKSAQHGGKYRPSDFRSFGREGKRLINRFLPNFRMDASGPFYQDSAYTPGLKVYTEHHSTRGHGAFGRDLSVTHQSGNGYIHWSSEFPGCGNGRYGLVANRKEYLWLEDD